MCISPCSRILYIAGHVNFEPESDYRYPTTTNTGRILRLDLEQDGSFQKDRDGLPFGYVPVRTIPLNRPSDPQFCRHGAMHVSSFCSSQEGQRRQVYKFAVSGVQWEVGTKWVFSSSTHPFYLEEECEPGQTSVNPWGVAFSRQGGCIYVTCQSDAQHRCLVEFPTCGCEYEQTQDEGSCGRARTLVGNGEFDQPNYVISIDD